MQFLDAVQPVIISENRIRAVDPAMVSFVNCNTPESYAAALDRYTVLKSDTTVNY
jgi:hypothetical protein